MGSSSINIQSVEEAKAKIIGTSLDKLQELVMDAASEGQNVLLVGAPGVGKELFANLFAASCEREVQAINMTGISGELVESELFGHKKGSFTGAVNDKDGVVAKYGRSHVLFFDELGDILSSEQAKLLRFIQFGSYQVVGHAKEENIPLGELRIVAASNKPHCIRDDLKERFRAFRIPSLVERLGDVPALIRHFAKDETVKFISRKALEGLSGSPINPEEVVKGDKPRIHSWLGNIRELQKVSRDACFLCKARHGNTLRREDFPSIQWSGQVSFFEGELYQNAAAPELSDYWQYSRELVIKDRSESLIIKTLKDISWVLPYHYFLKNLPREVSENKQLVNELSDLKELLSEAFETFAKDSDNVQSLQKEVQYTFENTSPGKWKEMFFQFHKNKGTEAKDLAEFLGCDVSTITRNFRKYGSRPTQAK